MTAYTNALQIIDELEIRQFISKNPLLTADKRQELVEKIKEQIEARRLHKSQELVFGFIEEIISSSLTMS